MAWYRTATVTVTNGSTIVTGSGTAWVGAIYAGWGFNGPNGQVIEIASVDSATQITLVSAYLGSTQAGAAYSIIPTQGLEQTLVASLSALISNYQGVYDGPGQGKFPDGTVAAPGVRFTADEDTGIYRPGSNQIATATGGVRRTLLSSTAYQVDVPITGTAVQSSLTDATSGKLLKVGAFGLGGSAIDLGASDNLNNITASGFYYNPASANTTSNNYPVSSAGSLLVIYDSADRITQHFTTYGNSGVFASYTRSRASTGWSAWRKVYDQGTIVGAVSQSSGIPTGAIIEYGNNSNGKYIRWADGTQACFQTVAPAVADEVWTFPAAFSTTDDLVCLGGARTSTDANFVSCRPPSVTNVAFNHWNHDGTRLLGYGCGLQATGRWF